MPFLEDAKPNYGFYLIIAPLPLPLLFYGLLGL